MKKSKIRKLVISILFLAILAAILFLLPANQQGIIDNRFFFFIITQALLLLIGCVNLVLRLSFFIKRDTTYYIFFGVANFALSIWEIYCYTTGIFDSFSAAIAIPNLIVGLIVIWDYFRNVNISHKQ